MAIQVSGTEVISNSRVLSNVTGLKTVNSTSLLGSGDIAAGLSYNLLGTIATTSGTTVTLSSLTLTSYKLLYCISDAISSNTSTATWMELNGWPVLQTTLNDAANYGTGIAIIDLASGVFGSSSGRSFAGNFYYNNSGGGSSGVTTASTSISFTLDTAASFDAGSIKIYGVK